MIRMLLSIPFYENNGEGNQCVQVGMKSVLSYFNGKEFSLEELDFLTGRRKGLWTWTPQCVAVLYKLGLDVKYYSKTDLKPFLEGESFIRSLYGPDAEKMLQFTDVPVVIDSIRKVLRYNIFEKKKLSLEEIETVIKKGSVPLVLIDNNKIAGKTGSYQGHFVAITGFDDNHIFYHESGPKSPQANKKVVKSLFIEAWNANGTDNDLVVVSGKRERTH
ncbi:MAG TPA: peptidase C39 family protein [Candidatus Nanoarchaeia archaeon]|nr:peptidase C39 family protein [Candidatus Nanoarchaeia archaeon]